MQTWKPTQEQQKQYRETARNKYREDAAYRERIQRQQRESRLRNREEKNRKRRERYATDSQYRERILENWKKSRMRPESIKRIKEYSKKLKGDPEHLRKVRERRKRRIELDPEFHRKENERRREWYRTVGRDLTRERSKRYRMWFDEYKKTLKCEKCGEQHSATIDFHHKNPDEKEKNIACLAARCSKKREEVFAEIRKCIVLCANCHRKLHWEIQHKDGEKR
jgi:hypothetical protein